jgi:hypothetical protein
MRAFDAIYWQDVIEPCGPRNTSSNGRIGERVIVILVFGLLLLQRFGRVQRWPTTSSIELGDLIELKRDTSPTADTPEHPHLSSAH